MKAKKQSQLGVTLLEILLVLAIGSLFIVLTIRQYRELNLDKDVQQLKANVNTLMQGMAAFYYVNCDGYYNPATGKIVTGKLNPYANSNNTYQVDVTSQLVNRGYILTTLATVLPFNALVNTATSAGQPFGYVVQFNRVDQNRNICTKGTNVKNGPNDPNCLSTAKTGVSVIWRAQVAVRLNSNIPASEYTAYKNITEADSLSTANGSTVNPCNMNTSGDYLVWERLPSMISTENQSTSTYWGNSANLREFNQLYTQFPDLSTDMPGANQGKMPPTGETHYYICGS